MKRIATDLVVLSVLSLGSSTWLAAQGLPVDRFLEGVSAHSVGDEVEQAQCSKLYDALNVASPAEVERVLPVLLQYSRPGNEIHGRKYAIMFLLAIAIRPDGADLLSTKSAEISSLLVDANPGIQHVAIAVTDFVIAKPATNHQPYVAAMLAAMQMPQTPQDVCVNIISVLLSFRRDYPEALNSVLGFLHRDDLTADTRRELVHSLGDNPGLPEEVSQYLVGRLDDSDLHVRAEALVSYANSIIGSRALADERKHPDPRLGPGAAAGLAAAGLADSKTAFHVLAKSRVQKMAHDPHEDPRLRALAKEALAGKYPLSPNIDLPPLDSNSDVPPERPPAAPNHQ